MSFNNIEEKLKNMAIKNLSKDEKNFLWSEIKNKINTTEKKHMTFNILSIFKSPKYKIAVPVFLILMLIGGSFVTVAAADSSKPGDFLFPVDLAAEKILIAISIGENKDKLRIKFSGERLDEVKEILALIKSKELFENNNNTATSTPDTTTSTSTDNGSNTATSTNVTRTTTPSNTTNFNSKGAEKAKFALEIALQYLQETKIDFEDEGKEEAVSAIDRIIGELTNIAENHVSDLDKFRAKIKKNDEKLKIEITSFSNEIKTKFKFSAKIKDNDDEDDKNEIKIKEKENGIRIKSGEIKIELKQKENKKDNDDDKNEDKVKKSKEKIKICHTTGILFKNNHTIKVSESSLNAHLEHGDIEGKCDDEDEDENECDDDDEDCDEDDEDEDEYDDDENENCDDNTATSTPDTIAPVISNINSIASTTSAEISWDTDEESNSVLWYSTTTPFVISGLTPTISNSNSILSHLLTITNITASSTYYYIVSSSDTSGNTATSSELSFTTLP